MTAAIEVEGLTKAFGERVAVAGIDLQVAEGHIVGFLGPNGSGKTTTIRMLCGLLTPDAGTGTCLGLDIRREAGAIKRQTGYMTQKFSFYEDLTGAENLDFVARAHGLAQRRQRVAETLEALNFGDRRDQLAGELSGGWKQRLALAASILHRPRLLLLDEPTAGVDPGARREFWSRIHELAADGMTVLVATHYMDEAERCHEIACIAKGRLLATGTVDDIIAGAGLTTLVAEPADDTVDMDALERELATRTGVSSTATFGDALHVTGGDRDALLAALAPYRARPDLTWREAPTSLEEAFVHLTAGGGGTP